MIEVLGADILAGSEFRVASGLILGKKARLVVGDTVLSNGKGGQGEKSGGVLHFCGCGVMRRRLEVAENVDAREGRKRRKHRGIKVF